MRLGWTEEAAEDLADRGLPLRAYAGPCGAPCARAVRRARQRADVPEPRQTWQEGGTRELVMSALPYPVVYTVRGDAVYVVRIMHGA